MSQRGCAELAGVAKVTASLAERELEAGGLQPARVTGPTTFRWSRTRPRRPHASPRAGSQRVRSNLSSPFAGTEDHVEQRAA